MTIIKAVAVAAGTALGIGGMVATVARPDRGETVIIPAGTTFMAVMEEDLRTTTSRPGDEFELRTLLPVRLAGGMEIPVGSEITGEILDDGDAEDGAPAPGIGVRFTELVFASDSSEVEIQSEQFRFGTHVRPVSTTDVIVPAGRRIAIRLTRPVTVPYHPTESTHTAE